MATYAAYRHIELDKVGYSKKRVRNPPSDIFNVLCTPPNNRVNGNHNSRRSTTQDNSFNKLFGSPESISPPRRLSLSKTDASRNPVTGDGVVSWDCRPDKKSPRVHTVKGVVKQRNPVTGEVYTIVSPASTPTKLPCNGFLTPNGNSTPIVNGNVTPALTNGNNNATTNGHA